MGLFLRMFIFYPFFMWLANQGVEVYDFATDTVTFQLEDVVTFAAGIGGYVATFLASRYGKKFLGWAT